MSPPPLSLAGHLPLGRALASGSRLPHLWRESESRPWLTGRAEGLNTKRRANPEHPVPVPSGLSGVGRGE